jgi:hypothetical protein
MTFLEAAETILRAAGKPLTAREITDIALREGLIEPSGKTPELTMSARLYTAPASRCIRRQFSEGGVRARRGSVRWIYQEPSAARVSPRSSG